MPTLPSVADPVTDKETRKTDAPDLSADNHCRLSSKEIQEIDMVFLGQTVLKQAKMLSIKVDIELLNPIRLWLKDPNWVANDTTSRGTDKPWANYKRKSRQWYRQQENLSKQRLNMYRNAIRSKKDKIQEISKLINEPNSASGLHSHYINDFLSPIIAPFSKSGQLRKALDQDFLHSMNMSELYLLPWRAILGADIKHKTRFSDLATYIPRDKKKDKVCKLITLLQLEHDGVLSLNQKGSFKEIEIKAKKSLPTNISLKDRQGNEWQERWADLCNNKKKKILKKIRSNQIICRYK